MNEAPEVEEPLAAPPPELREALFMIPMTSTPAVLPSGVSADDLHKQIMFQLAYRFRGATSYPVLGSWKSGEGELAAVMVEPMMEVRCAIPEADQADFHDYAMAACKAFKQEALYWRDRSGVSHIEPVIHGRIH